MIPYVFRYKINTTRAGWSEGFHGNFADHAACIVAGRLLLGARRGLLAKNATIVEAACSKLGMPPDTVRLRGGPWVGGTFTNVANAPGFNCNVAADSIHFTLRTVDGHICQRHLRGVPDDWLLTEELAEAGLLTEYTHGAGVPPLEQATEPMHAPREYMRMFAHILMTHFGSIRVIDRAPRKGTQVKGRPIDWSFHPYRAFEVVRAATKRVGRPSGPFRGRQRSRCPKKKILGG